MPQKPLGKIDSFLE